MNTDKIMNAFNGSYGGWTTAATSTPKIDIAAMKEAMAKAKAIPRGPSKMVVSEHMLTSRWIFPADRLVKYGPEDEWWARKYRFGHEVFEPGSAIVGDSYVIHPTIFEQMKKVAEKRVATAADRLFGIPIFGAIG